MQNRRHETKIICCICRNETPDHSPDASASSKFNFKTFFKQIFGCIQKPDESEALQNIELSSNVNVLERKEFSGTFARVNRCQIKPTPQKLEITQESRQFGRTKSEELLHISKSGTRVYDSTGSVDRTDFATVAFSVKAFVTLKKAVRERRKQKERKLRQFRKMSIAIVVAYTISWLPFQINSLVSLTLSPETLQSFCIFETCSNYSFSREGKELILTNNSINNMHEPAFRVAFLWCLLFASFSPIADAILYSFSRENIRKEVKKSYQQVTKSNEMLSDLPVKRGRTRSLRAKTTEFISLDILQKTKCTSKKRKAEIENHSNTAPSCGKAQNKNGKQVPQIVPLKDPDASPVNLKEYNVGRKHSITSLLSSNKSTFETSCINSKSSTNSLD